MFLRDIISILEKNYPPFLSYDWDNSGLILGNKEKEIKKCLVSLDITENVIKQAIDNGAELIISHHPLIFSGVKNITSDNLLGSLLLKACENNISIYAAHTNMDCAPYGINKKLAEVFALKNCEILEKNPLYSDSGLGCLGDVDEISLLDFLKIVKEKLNLSYVRFSGNKNQIIKKVAISSGSGADLIPLAIEAGADTIITGDLKYHTALDYANENFSIIDAGHFATEYIAIDMFFDVLKSENLEIIKANQKDIFNII